MRRLAHWMLMDQLGKSFDDYLRPEARAGAQLPQDERRTEEASPEGARQLGLF